jgi:hypothetical protein
LLLFSLLFSLFFGVAVLFFMIVDIVILSDINLIVSYLNSFLDDFSHVYQDIFGTREFLLFIPTLVCMWRINMSSSNVCWWCVMILSMDSRSHECLIARWLRSWHLSILCLWFHPGKNALYSLMVYGPKNLYYHNPSRPETLTFLISSSMILTGILTWQHLLMHVWWKIH